MTSYPVLHVVLIATIMQYIFFEMTVAQGPHASIHGRMEKALPTQAIFTSNAGEKQAENNVLHVNQRQNMVKQRIGFWESQKDNKASQPVATHIVTSPGGAQPRTNILRESSTHPTTSFITRSSVEKQKQVDKSPEKMVAFTKSRKVADLRKLWEEQTQQPLPSLPTHTQRAQWISSKVNLNAEKQAISLSSTRVPLTMAPIDSTAPDHVSSPEAIKIHLPKWITPGDNPTMHTSEIIPTIQTKKQRVFLNYFRRNRPSPSPSTKSVTTSHSNTVSESHRWSMEDQKIRNKHNMDELKELYNEIGPYGRDIISKISTLSSFAKEAANYVRLGRVFVLDTKRIPGVENCLFPTLRTHINTYCTLTPSFLHLHEGGYTEHELLSPHQIQMVLRYMDLYFHTQSTVQPRFIQDIVRKKKDREFDQINLYPVTFSINLGNACESIEDVGQQQNAYCLRLIYTD